MQMPIPIPVAVLLLVFARWAALAAVLPGSGLLPLPVRFRLAAAAAISILLAPLQLSALPAPPPAIELAWMAGHELMIGLAIGTAVLLMIQGLQLAAQLISQLSGFSLRGLLTGTGIDSQPAPARLIVFCVIAALLAIGGHRQVMDVALSSYQQAPAGTSLASTNMLATVTRLFSMSFLVALRISLPVVTALLLGLLVSGWISRLVPQLNMLVLGWNTSALLGMVLILFTIGGMSWVFQEQLAEAMRLVGDFWQPA